MKRISQTLFLVAITAMIGCGDDAKTPEGSGPDVTAVSYALCADCGQQAAGDKCCVAEAVVCEKCSLHEGSPGCCKMTKGDADVKICACGHIEGTELCCSDTVAKCEKCGMFEGSPGCCKIDTAAKAPAATK